MALLLAIESSGDRCSVAIGDEVIEELSIDQVRGHNEFLLPAIDRLLREAGYHLRQLDAIAVGVGPGSFTGLRIGIGVAQGLAFGADLGVIPVSSLAALVQSGVREGVVANGEFTLAAVDARMGQVYWGGDEIHAGLATSVMADRLSPPDALGEALQSRAPGDWIALGDGWAQADPALLKFARRNSSTVARASAVLALGQPEFRAGAVLAPERLEPRYLRGSEHWQKWRGAGPATSTDD